MKTLLNFIKKREERKIRLEIFKAMISNGGFNTHMGKIVEDFILNSDHKQP